MFYLFIFKFCHLIKTETKYIKGWVKELCFNTTAIERSIQLCRKINESVDANKTMWVQLLLQQQIISIKWERNKSDPVQYLRKRPSSFWSLSLMNRKRWFDTIVSDTDCGNFGFCHISCLWLEIFSSLVQIFRSHGFPNRSQNGFPAFYYVGWLLHHLFMCTFFQYLLEIVFMCSCDCWQHWVLHPCQHFGSLGALHLKHPSLLD